MLINPQYEALLGAVEDTGKGSTQTLFYHFMGLPLFPQESYFVQGSTMFSWSNVKVMEVKRSMPSILKAYACGWTGVGGLYVTLVGVGLVFMPPQIPYDPMPFGISIFAPIAMLLGLGSVFVSLVALFLLRRPLSADERAKREIYEELTGSRVDPALLKDAWSLRDDLKRGIAGAAEAAGLGRHLFDEWQTMSLRPELADPRILRMALTLSRVVRGSPEEGKSAESYDAIHEQLWARLRGR